MKILGYNDLPVVPSQQIAVSIELTAIADQFWGDFLPCPASGKDTSELLHVPA